MQLKMRNLKVRRKAKRWGFTIGEVLLVVLIIGLISTTGAGLYVGTFRKMRVEKAAYDFLLTAQYARIMAIETQSRYKMQLDPANNGFYLTTLQWDEEGEQAMQQIVKNPYCRPVEFEGDVVFEGVEIVPNDLESEMETESDSEGQQTIVFSPNGTAQSAAIQIGNGDIHYAISVSATTGRAKMYFGTAETIKVNSIDLDAE
jgi:type II secretory pathway pseudopilin PulG